MIYGVSSACSLKIFSNSVLKLGFRVLLVVWLAVFSYVVMMWIDGIHRVQCHCLNRGMSVLRHLIAWSQERTEDVYFILV